MMFDLKKSIRKKVRFSSQSEESEFSLDGGDELDVTDCQTSDLRPQPRPYISSGLMKAISLFKPPFLELRLQNIEFMPQDCLKLAKDSRTSTLRILDLSCNPIGSVGLCNLLRAS